MLISLSWGLITQLVCLTYLYQHGMADLQCRDLVAILALDYTVALLNQPKSSRVLGGFSITLMSHSPKL